MKYLFLVIISLSYMSSGWTLSKSDEKKITDQLIKESIASYPGRCPCPYNKAKDRSQCGKRSAYTRSGGYHPLCYPKDVTKRMIMDRANKTR